MDLLLLAIRAVYVCKYSLFSKLSIHICPFNIGFWIFLLHNIFISVISTCSI